MRQGLLSSKILFVSTSYIFYDVRYGFRDFSDSYKRYQNTLNFFEKVDKSLLKKFEFKDSPDGHFSEKDYLKKKYKDIKFLNEIPEKKVANSRLAIINNYSTFFYKCLSSNIPTILLTEIDTWKLHEKSKKIYENLQKCGIIISDMSLAANKVNFSFDNIYEWWKSDQVQKSRKDFCNEFAWSEKDYFKYWLKYLWKL